MDITGQYKNRDQELVLGTEENDNIYPLGGWDVVDGRGGEDTVYVQGLSANFKLVRGNDVVYIDSLTAASSYAERTQLKNVEYIQFTDKTISLKVPLEFEGRAGDDEFVGGPGLDVLKLFGRMVDYRVYKSGIYHFVDETSGGLWAGRDRIQDIERLRFDDGGLAIDMTGTAGAAARMVGALLGTNFLADRALMGLVIREADARVASGLTVEETMHDLAELGLSSGVVADIAGSNSSSDFVRLVYTNVVGQPPSNSELQHYVSLIESGQSSRAELAVMAAGLELTASRINLTGLASNGLAFEWT